MTKLSIQIGVVLALLGIGSYIFSGRVSLTALIPAFFGIIIWLLGIVGKKESRRKLTMHIAMVIALIGIIGSFMGIVKVISLLFGAELVRPLAAWMQAIMALILIYYLAMGIRSFVIARKK